MGDAEWHILKAVCHPFNLLEDSMDKSLEDIDVGKEFMRKILVT